MVQKFKKSRLSWYKQEQLIEHVIWGSTACCADELLGLNPKTSAYYFYRLREIRDIMLLMYQRLNICQLSTVNSLQISKTL